MAMTMFQTQLNTMVMWFDQWSESGQTVALFKMLTRLAPVQARFVSIALEHSLMECAELALREQEANNPGEFFHLQHSFWQNRGTGGFFYFCVDLLNFTGWLKLR